MIDFHRLTCDGDVYLFSAVAGRTNLPPAPAAPPAEPAPAPPPPPVPR